MTGWAVYRLDEMPVERVREGFTRSAVRADGSLVTVNWLEPGYRTQSQHEHECDQLSFVLSGGLRFTVGDDTVELTAPAVLYIPGGVPHSAEPIGDERVLNLDVFAPVRDDYRYLTDYQDEPRAAEGR